MTANADIVRMVSNLWKVLCADLSTTEERQYSSGEFGSKAKVRPHAAGRAMRFFRGIGLLNYRSEYSSDGTGGQRVYMRLGVPLEEGLTAIYKHFDAGRSYSWFESGNPGGAVAHPGIGKGRRGPQEPQPDTSKPVIADERSPEVVRAIAGPEPESPLKAALQPLRKDEVEALVEAARQYANRGDAVQAKVKELAALGVTVDETLLAKAIAFEVDPRLEAIASVLPYIDRLERNNRSLSASVGSDKAEVIELRRANGVLARERNELKDANRRLSERNVALQGAKPVSAQA